VTQVWDRVVEVRDADDGRPVYERIADVIAASIRDGELTGGVRLPTVRDLSRRLGVSSTTVMSVYNRLADSGMVRGETGRGTFVNAPAAAPADPAPRPVPAGRTAWRRQSLAQAEARLRAAFPGAADLMRGSPDHELFPLPALRRAFHDAAESITARSLEYPSHLDVDPVLAGPALEVLERDGVPATADQLLVMGSSQQFLQLFAQVLVQDADGEPPVVAVEEPGYQTAMDTFERAGCVLVGVSVDEQGTDPAALDAALAAGAAAVLFTPRAQSPTGAGWTAPRRAELADVLARHRRVRVLEDDHFAEAARRSVGSLRSDRRIADRVVHVRSFSKSLAPDLRLSVGVADPDLRAQLHVHKSFADGWTSHITQRAVGALLGDEAVTEAMNRAREVYAERRTVALDVLRETLPPAAGLPEPDAIDGLHVWVALPPACSAHRVVEDAAREGILVAPGEPFFLRPGDDRYVRINVGVADTELVRRACRVLGQVVERAARVPNPPLLTP
jgi:GntR family transcriptional regulator/MocR family aminotransferase